MKSFWLGAAVRDRVGRGRSETQMLITAHPVSVAGKTKSIFYELRGSNTTCSRCHSLRSLWHFFCWLPSLFHRFLLHAAARKFFLHHFGSPWKKSQWPTEIAGHVFWPCGSGFDGSRRGAVGEEGACCGCVPRPAIAVVQCTSSSFCEPSKWNVKLNGNNFDWIFLCTIRLTKSRWKYRSKRCAQLAAYPVVR